MKRSLNTYSYYLVNAMLFYMHGKVVLFIKSYLTVSKLCLQTLVNHMKTLY